jgi:iron complex outermembrane receptor protein
MQSVAVAAILTPCAAFAQSTGSIDFDSEIVVTGARIDQGVGGVVLPDSSKAKGVLTQEMISKQVPGNTILDTINLLPGVNFQNNDPFGAAGGTLNIRGFGPDRVSLTFDGIPLNDTGNYAIYSSQQLDPELIDQVSVNLGSTDIDSPTAAASGGTVNYRSRNPKDDFGAEMTGSMGEYNFMRAFAVIDTGAFTPWGTKAWFSGSMSTNDNVFNNYGKIYKEQINGKIYQPIGSNGDFISIAGNYSQSRNNFFGSLPLRTDTDTGRVPGPLATNRFPITKDERFYTLNCTTSDGVTVRRGVADAANSCGTAFDYRTNPSNTGNIRINSRFTLTDKLVLTVDPSFQYTKANGGGTVAAREALYDMNPTGGRANCGTTANGANVSCIAGYFGGAPYFGRDLNGDGDLLDQVLVAAPSQTQTRRYGLISSLRYDLDDSNTIRIAYTFDRGNHRQTGEVTFLNPDVSPYDVFPVNDPARDVNGNILQKRDRQSYATLHQVAGQYRGSFFADALKIDIGVRAPFFKRDLTNNCYTSSAGGFVECFGTGATIPANYGTLNPTFQPNQNRVLKYDKILPSGGLTFNITNAAQIFASYSKGLQVPSTDSLYNSFFFASGTEGAQPKPETTDSFEAGARYTTSTLQIQATGWYTKYKNRLASAYDPELLETVYRNLGEVTKFGFDGSIGYSPIPEVTLYAFGSYLDSEIKDDVQIGNCTVVSVATGCTAIGNAIYAATAGKRESGASKYSFGGRAEVTIEGLHLGLQAKRYGKRFVYDTNQPTYRGTVGAPVQIYSAATPAYTLVDLDARYSLEKLGAKNVWVQLNVSNLFDKFYVGGFGGGLNQTITTGTGAYGNPGFVQIGSPRAVMGSIHVGL